MAMSNERIDNILRRIRERGTFGTIGRFRYDLDVATEMNVIEEIGKMRTPAFIIDEHNRFTYENIVKWLIGDKTAMALNPETKEPQPADFKAGIYIAGNTGSGKSWCLDIIAEYSSINAFKVSFGDATGVLNWRNIRADVIADRFQETGTIPFKDSKEIGIQDIGCEPVESVYMGNRVNVIRQLLEFRGDLSDALTFATSNMSWNNPAMKERYGDRVLSRFHEMFNYYEIKGVDRRKNK